MNRVIAVAVIACLGGARAAAGQPADVVVRPYRIAMGVSAQRFRPGRLDFALPGSFGLSVSKDAFTMRHWTLRGDAMAGPDGSALTADAVFSLRVFRFNAYSLLGAGVAGEYGMALVWAGGADFRFRDKPLFAEVRAYRQTGEPQLRMGVRF